MSKIINILIYGCDSKEDFDCLKTTLLRRNYSVMRIIAVITFVYFAGLYFSTFGIDSIIINRRLYAVFALMEAVCCIMFFTVAKPDSKLVEVAMYLTISTLLAFGVLLGSVVNTDSNAVTTHVLIVALPLLNIDKPYRLSILEMIAVIAFCVIVSFTEIGKTRELDLYNGVIFGLVGQTIIYYMTTVRMYHFKQSFDFQRASVTDELTGLYNRFAYENHLRELDQIGIGNDLVYISMDLNGLKAANDNYGHDAGDEILVAAANNMKQVFSPYGRVYRVGGDEFSAIITADSRKLNELQGEFQEICDAWHGQKLDWLAVSSGYVAFNEMPNSSVNEVIVEADKKMYKEKNNFYRKMGIDRRGVREVNSAMPNLYSVILKVDLTDHTVLMIKKDDRSYFNKIVPDTNYSQFMNNVRVSGVLNENEINTILEKSESSFVINFFSKPDSIVTIPLTFVDGDIRQPAILEILKADNEYNDHMVIYYFVKIINETQFDQE